VISKVEWIKLKESEMAGKIRRVYEEAVDGQLKKSGAKPDRIPIA
jgi:hypothetical protein